METARNWPNLEFATHTSSFTVVLFAESWIPVGGEFPIRAVSRSLYLYPIFPLQNEITYGGELTPLTRWQCSWSAWICQGEPNRFPSVISNMNMDGTPLNANHLNWHSNV